MHFNDNDLNEHAVAGDRPSLMDITEESDT